MPNAKRIGILADPDQIRHPDALDRAARDFGIEIVQFTATSNEEIIDAIDTMKAKSIDAVNVLASARLWSIHSLILDRLSSHRVSSIWQWPQGADDGGLIAYGVNPLDLYRRSSSYIDRILKGENAGDLAIQAPVKFDLIVNLKTAKAMGLKIPETVLLLADDVIE